MQYLLNVQRQVGLNWAFEAGYLGSVSHHLYGFQNANQAVLGTTGNIASRVPFPNFGVIQLVHDSGNANYHSGSLRVTRRYSQGMSLTSSYTWSKSIDTSSGIRNQGFDTLFPQDNRCLRCERALSSFDTRHRLVAGAVYELPAGKGKHFNIEKSAINTLLGGWSLSGGMTIQSGVPQTLTIGGVDNASTGNQGTDRPSYTGAGNGYAANRTTSRWYDPASFVEAPAGTFGNLGRNTMTTPHFQSIDLALHKTFQLPYNEHHNVQFRLETFNTFNHEQFNGINTGLNVPNAGQPVTEATQGTLGQVNSFRDPRQIQAGLKVYF